MEYETKKALIEPVCFSPRDAALYLRLTRPTIYKLMDSGTLQSVKLGANRRIPKAAIDKLLESAA
jgi:excisionase family DNA binding protein